MKPRLYFFGIFSVRVVNEHRAELAVQMPFQRTLAKETKLGAIRFAAPVGALWGNLKS
jgi:hypothetical protein